MGLREWLYGKVAKSEGEKLAEEFKESKMLDWLHAHKTQMGVLFTALTGVAFTFPDPHHYIAFGAGIIASFLVGAGALPSDYHVKEAQADEAAGIPPRKG